MGNAAGLGANGTAGYAFESFGFGGGSGLAASLSTGPTSPLSGTTIASGIGAGGAGIAAVAGATTARDLDTVQAASVARSGGGAAGGAGIGGGAAAAPGRFNDVCGGALAEACLGGAGPF
jgi:hypothetical protein